MTKSIHSLLASLEATKSRNVKKEIIAKVPDMNDGGVAGEVLQFALNPYKTYGIVPKKFPAPDPKNDKKFIGAWKEIKPDLEAINSKEITGKDAQRVYEQWMSREYAAPIISRIFGKDLRAGVGISTINSALCNAIPDFTVCLAKTFQERWSRFPAWVEPKFDGVRTITIIDQKGNVSLYSRHGRSYNNFPNIQKSVKALGLRGVVLDGEVIGSSFNTVMRVAHRKSGLDDSKLVYFIFDILPSEVFARQGDSDPFSIRHSKLLNLILGGYTSRDTYLRVVQGISVDNINELWDAHHTNLSAGYEGSIAKDPNALYEFKRSRTWLKLKPDYDYDCEVVGSYEGEGRLSGSLGGFIVSIDGVKTRVGSGFNDNQRNEIWKSKKDYLGRIVEVKGQELTDDGRIRFPRFNRFREDKE